MNYIILYATSIITKTKINKVRILIGSALGAIYSIVIALNILQIYSNSIFKVFFSVVMVYISLGSKTLKKLIRDVLMFYLTTFTFGGVALALLYFINPKQILIKNGIYLGTYALKIALMAGILGYIIITTAFKIKKRISKKSIICEIRIKENEKAVLIKALIDTGNFLVDPISKDPVVVIETKALEEIYPKEVLNSIENIINGEKLETKVQEEFASKLRIIPFSSLGKENGMLIGFKKDYIEVYIDEEVKIIKNIILGLYDKKISKSGLYQALLSLEILDRGENNENSKGTKTENNMFV